MLGDARDVNVADKEKMDVRCKKFGVYVVRSGMDWMLRMEVWKVLLSERKARGDDTSVNQFHASLG